MTRLTAIAVAALVAVGTISVVPADAEACDQRPPQEPLVVEDDSPDCAEIGPFHGFWSTGTPVEIEIVNECDVPFELEAVECAGCQSSLTVEPIDDSDDDGESNDNDFADGHGDTENHLTIDDRTEDELEAGETYEYYFTWQLEDQTGSFIVEMRHHGDVSTPPPCVTGSEDRLHGCSTAGASLPVDTIVLVALFAVAIGFRRIGLQSTSG